MSAGPILVFGLSEAASAVAHRLARAGRRVALAANAPPKVHRRRMSFADVWWDGTAVLSGLACVKLAPERLTEVGWPAGPVPFLALDTDAALGLLPWPVAVDARLAKRGPALRLRGKAALSIEPRAIDGVGRERIVYAPAAGELTVLRDIGDPVAVGDIVARIGTHPVAAPIAGTLRGMLRDGIAVEIGDKVCEVDPRPPGLAVCTGIGQRPAAIAEGVWCALGMPHPRLSDDVPPINDLPEPLVVFTSEKKSQP